MKLATFQVHGSERIGVVSGDSVVDLSQAAPELPCDMIGLLGAGAHGMAAAYRAAESAPAAARHLLSDVRLLAPVPRPGKFFAVGLNYADHVAEGGGIPGTDLTVFLKAGTSVVGTGTPVERPTVSEQLDYEGELGVVIGQRCRHVTRERAAEVIAGYVVINDVSVRDWQMKTPQWTLGKSFDTHGVVGPWITTPEDVDHSALVLRTFVNGDLRQESSTSHMLWDCAAQIEVISQACTLEPGDIIATGTPAGVGGARTPQQWLRAGDVVRVEIDTIGHVENTIVDEVVVGQTLESAGA